MKLYTPVYHYKGYTLTKAYISAMLIDKIMLIYRYTKPDVCVDYREVNNWLLCWLQGGQRLGLRVDYRKVNGLVYLYKYTSQLQGLQSDKGVYKSVRLLDKSMPFYSLRLHRWSLFSTCGALLKILSPGPFLFNTKIYEYNELGYKKAPHQVTQLVAWYNLWSLKYCQF